MGELTAKHTTQERWEEKELENPIGYSAWVFNNLTRELIVLDSVDVVEDEKHWGPAYNKVFSIVFAGNITYICDNAFQLFTFVKSIKIPSSVKSIGDEAFHNCYGLTSVTIPASVETIGNDVFYQCSIVSIKLPRSNITFTGNPFTLSKKIKEIDTSENPNFDFIDGVLYGDKKTRIIYCNFSKSGDYIIPNTVRTIGRDAFYFCDKLTSVIIPNSVTSIEEKAFYGCRGLKTVEMGESVKVIEKNAFSECWNMTSMTISGGVEFLGPSVLTGSRSLAELKFVGELLNFKMVDGVLFDKDMTRLIWYSHLREGPYEMPNTVKTVDDWLFTFNRYLTSITTSSSMMELYPSAFSICSSLESATIQNAVSIRSDMFYQCKRLKSVIILGEVTSIGRQAFYECYSLRSVTLPNSVTVIDEYAFSDCYELESITFPDSLTIICKCAFCLCNGLQSITLPSSLITIEEQAFQVCNRLESVTLPDSLVYIFHSAFAACRALKSIKIPKNVESLGNEIFYNCPSLESALVPAGLEYPDDVFPSETKVTVYQPD